MKKLLIYLMILPMWLHGQVTPTTKNPDGSIVLSGKGSLGGLNDNVQLRRYKFPAQGNFEVSGYFRSISNKNSAVGFIFRNEGNATNKSLATAGVILQRDSLKCVIRYRNNTTMDLVASTPNVPLPCYLKIEKNGNSLKYYYSKQPENAPSPNWILVLKVENVFTEWTGLNHNVLNPTGQATATAVLASLNFKAVTLDTDTDTRPSCNNGGSFVLASVTKTTGTLYNVDFSAANLTSAQVIIKNTVTNSTVRDITQAITARPQSVDFGTLQNGSYTVQLVGKSCKGSTNEKAFTVAGVTPPPTLFSCSNGGNFTIASVVNTAGSTSYAVDFNAANFSNAQVLIKNSAGTVVNDLTQAITARPQNINFGTLATGSYTVQFVGLSCSGTSNAFAFSAVGPIDNRGTGQSTFVNILKTIPTETLTDKYSVNLFPTIGTKLKNIANGRQKAIFPVIWHTKLTNFISANKKTWDVGISSPVDIVPNMANQEGDGVRCLDYIMYANPNTGLPYVNGIDTECNQNINTFISRRPFQYRVKGEGGTIESMAGWSLEQYYDEGVQYTNGDKFGFGDVVNGKNNIGFNVTDVENGEHGRFDEIPISIGMANTTFGDAISMYNQSINIVNPELSHYPLNYITGGYVANRVKLDGTPAPDGNGNLQQNNVINDAWKPENKVTIPSRGINNKGLIDYENVLESSEVSCLSSAAFHQGELINYDNDNKNLTRVTNKFGLNRNAEHIVAHTKYATEVRKWHLRKNFNDRHFYTLTKDLCDRLNVGLTNYGKFGGYVDNVDLQAYHLPRDLVFMNTMVTAFSGSYIYEWDRNTIGKMIDGKNGKLYAINLLNQRKNLSQGSLSFVDLFESFDYKLWTAEISYDGGTTWKQEKGTDLIMNQTSLTHQQVITPNGVWGVFVARPENTEALTCKLRIMYSGSYRYLDITPSMWETTNYAQRNTALANIPDVDKDYYYNLIDLTENGGVGTTTVNPPNFTANPTSPIAGSSVTFSVSNCSGTVKIFADDAQVSTATSYTVSSPVFNISYSATCTVSGVSSVASSAIVIQAATQPPSGGVTITYPSGYTATSFSGNQPKYHWDNHANIPAIFTNVPQYVENTDVVTMQNSQMIIKIDLKAGGQICFAATASNPTKNLVYVGYDRGFEWQADYTQHLEGGVINGQTSGSPQNNSHYNTTQGGDHLNHGTHLTDYYATADGFYTEVRPILYPFNSLMSQVKIQTTYKLIGNMLKVNYRYISFRTDPGLETGNAFRFKGFDLPVMFCLEEYSKFAYYAGGNPWENVPMSEGDVPNNTQGGQFLGANSTERWAMVWNPANSQAIGVFNKSVGGSQTTVGFEQLNKFVGSSQGTNTSGPYTVMKVSDTESVLNGGNYVHESEAWITFGDKNLIRGRFDLIKNN